CADGVPPDPLPTLALDDDEELTVTFGLDWTLQATMVPVDGDVCDGAWTVDVAGDGSGVSTLGRAGEYRVDPFGRGEQGDAAFAFGLATTRDRPAPAPYFTAGWHPAGMELDPTAPCSACVGNLVEMPETLSAVAELTSSSGESKTFALTGEVFQD